MDKDQDVEMSESSGSKPRKQEIEEEKDDQMQE